MLDDINKIIPKLEEKDSDIIFNNITRRKETKKKNVFNNKFIVSFASFVLLLLIAIPIGLMGDKPNNEDPEINGGNTNTEEYNYNVLFNETSVIGIAAFNEFDKTDTLKLSNLSVKVNYKNSNINTLDEDVEESSDEIEDLNEEIKEPLKVSYPYDYVKILNAYKFTINVPDIDDATAKNIIENSCGLGELEVVVAEFETYIDENGMYLLSVQDTLISLRGHNGYYTILVNSGAYTNDTSLQVFSSHKKLTEEEVSKDFTPPILSIFLKESNNERYVYFETSDNLLSFGSYNQELAFNNIDDIERVSRNTLYSVFELTKLPVKEVEANVLEINSEDNIIKVQTEFKLEFVYINEHTEGVELENINVGDIVVVEYDFLFEKYDPTSVLANSINLKSIAGD